MRKHIDIEEVFRNNIVSHIKGAFFRNPNLENNYFYAMNKYELRDYIKSLAQELLDEIDNTQHLILDNGVKELQEEVKVLQEKLNLLVEEKENDKNNRI